MPPTSFEKVYRDLHDMRAQTANLLSDVLSSLEFTSMPTAQTINAAGSRFSKDSVLSSSLQLDGTTISTGIVKLLNTKERNASVFVTRKGSFWTPIVDQENGPLLKNNDLIRLLRHRNPKHFTEVDPSKDISDLDFAALITPINLTPKEKTSTVSYINETASIDDTMFDAISTIYSMEKIVRLVRQRSAPKKSDSYDMVSISAPYVMEDGVLNLEFRLKNFRPHMRSNQQTLTTSVDGTSSFIHDQDMHRFTTLRILKTINKALCTFVENFDAKQLAA